MNAVFAPTAAIQVLTVKARGFLIYPNLHCVTSAFGSPACAPARAYWSHAWRFSLWTVVYVLIMFLSMSRFQGCSLQSSRDNSRKSPMPFCASMNASTPAC